jgi:hypothetical protein
MFGRFQMMLCGSHRLQRLVNVRMPLRRRGYRRYRWNRCDGRGWRSRRFRSGGYRRKGECNDKRCRHEQSQESNLFQVFLLVRLAARTQPMWFLATDVAPLPEQPATLAQYMGSHEICRDAEGYWADALVRPCADAATTESLRSTTTQLRSQYRTSSCPSRAVPNAAQTNTPHLKSPLPRPPRLES